MHVFFKHLSKNCNYCLYLHTACKYKNTTFVNILLIYSHYKPSKAFLKGALFLATPCILFHSLQTVSTLYFQPLKNLNQAATINQAGVPCSTSSQLIFSVLRSFSPSTFIGFPPSLNQQTSRVLEGHLANME